MRARSAVVSTTALFLLLGTATVSSGQRAAVERQAPLAPTSCATTLGCGADLDAALELERRIADHTYYGLVLPIDYNTPERVLGDVRNIAGQWGDAGIWSGNYLAAESYRYAIANSKLRGHGAKVQGLKDKDKPKDDKGEDRDFWLAQRGEAKARIDSLVAQVDLRTNIARAWVEPVNPTVDPGTVPPSAGLGGVVQGEAGMLMYSCAPNDAPPAFAMGRNADVRGPWHWKGDASLPSRLVMPENDYICEASTTRDAYAGTLFGLLAAFDLVSADDQLLRRVIRDDIFTITDYLVRHGWSWVRPDAKVGRDQYSNVVNPLMVISPTYRLGLTQAARHVAQVAGTQVDVAKWEAIYAEEFATQATAGDAIADLVNDPSPTADYYGWNLAHLMYFNLIRLSQNPAEKAIFRQNFSIIDRQTSDDVNAFFETVSYTFTGEASRRDPAVQHLREWRDYRAKLDVGGTTNNSARCGTEIECVPEDEYDIITSTPAGDVPVHVEGSSTRMRAVNPLPVAERRPADFLWQRSPFTGLDGSVEANHQEPGIDYLLPYWMLRYYTEIAPPALDPIAVWHGPKYSGS